MLYEVFLNKWADECKKRNIQWFLFKETLLCAEGYHTISKGLEFAQIVVFSKDIEEIDKYVFPAMEQLGSISRKEFSTNKGNLYLIHNKSVVLEINILCDCNDDDDMREIGTAIRNFRRKISKRARRFEKIRSIQNNIINESYNSLLSYQNDDCKTKKYYCDCYTNKKPVLLSKELFCNTEFVLCKDEYCIERKYPVFSGYQTYLKIMYGDYQNGLNDDVGCGLTSEEKVELKEHQHRCLEALKFVNNLSKEFDLEYYLVAGSVLGAVRHGGFIPWDDDIDLGIRVERIEEFEDYLRKHIASELPEGYTLEQSEPYNPYPRMFSKICYEGRCCIDLWPLVPTYEDGFRAVYTWRFAKLFTKIHYLKIDHKVKRYRRLAKAVGIFFNDKQIMRMARYNERKYIGKQTPAYINIYSIYKRDKETIKRMWLDEKKFGLFEGIEVPLIGHTEDYLIHLYGDYMKKPLPWKRISRHTARFDDHRNNEKNLKLLKDKITNMNT